jgi:hypothetical protein
VAFLRVSGEIGDTPVVGSGQMVEGIARRVATHVAQFWSLWRARPKKGA